MVNHLEDLLSILWYSRIDIKLNQVHKRRLKITPTKQEMETEVQELLKVNQGLPLIEEQAEIELLIPVNRSFWVINIKNTRKSFSKSIIRRWKISNVERLRKEFLMKEALWIVACTIIPLHKLCKDYLVKITAWIQILVWKKICWWVIYQ